MPDQPGVQYAVYDTAEDKIVRIIGYAETFDWSQDYEAGNSRFAVVTRRIPKWEHFDPRVGRHR